MKKNNSEKELLIYGPVMIFSALFSQLLKNLGNEYCYIPMIFYIVFALLGLWFVLKSMKDIDKKINQTIFNIDKGIIVKCISKDNAGFRKDTQKEIVKYFKENK